MTKEEGMVLQLVKMGLDFDSKYNAKELEYSDLENHRLRLHFTDKEGYRIYGDVCCWDTASWQASIKRVDKKWKFITDIPLMAITPDLEVYRMVDYSNRKQVMCFRYGDRKAENNYKDVFPYTKKGLLDFVNGMSKDTYTDIEFVPYEELDKWSAWVHEQEKELIEKAEELNNLKKEG